MPALAAASIVGAAWAPSAAWGSETTYLYRIEHPRYGNIGTYSNRVKTSGDDCEVDTEMHIAVKVLGIVMYREDAQRVELWKNDRFVDFRGVTVTNGDRIEVHGEAQGDSFVVTTPAGVLVGPANVHPSNPWGPMVLQTDMEMSTKTGRIEKATVTDGGLETVRYNGVDVLAHRYEITASAKPQTVWLDDRGTVIAFQVEVDGALINFVLSSAAQASVPQQAAQQ